MMPADDWGRNPEVRKTRELFCLLEQRQRELLEGLGIPRFDGRLRRWREQARILFERSWAEALRAGGRSGTEEAADLYARGLRRILASAGVPVPPEGDRS